MSLSIINYYGKQNSRCGYCGGTQCSSSHGMHAYNLSAQDYQELIDRGWRRSGQYCYKPDNKMTCCPCYTIRCNAIDFQMSKSHRKVLNRMNRFLRDGLRDKSDELAAVEHSVRRDDGGSSGTDLEPKAPDVPIKNVCLDAVVAANPKRQAASGQEISEIRDQMPMLEKTSPAIVLKSEGETISVIDSISSSSTSKADCKKSASDESQNPPRKKAKQIRLERRQAKGAAKNLPSDEKCEKRVEKTLSDYFSDAKAGDKHKLKIITVPSAKQGATDEAFNLYRKYQLTIHNDNPERVNLTGFQRFLYKSPLKLVQVQSTEFQLSLKCTYALYQKYQTRIHNEPPQNVQDYLDFLQRSPLKPSKPQDATSVGYGSFHQQYWLDDKLIAVGVIDILPYCVSSVYFFYDPDYSFLSLGTYGSLREIDYVRELSQSVPVLKYYYMGFYIHSCPKMRYKGKLVPSYLLCPETYTWQLLTKGVCKKLDEQKYQRLNADSLAKDLDEFSENHLDLVLLLTENTRCITYRDYIQSFNIQALDNMLDIIRSRIYKEITGEEDDRVAILEYGKLVGKTCAHRMLYLIN